MDLIGEGLWSRVYDLGDGRVKKITRRHCGGLGDGLVKQQEEIENLNALKGVFDFKIPCVLESGLVGTDTPEYQQGFRGWLVLDQMPGRSLKIEDVAALSPDRQRILGHNLGSCLTHLHERINGPKVTLNPKTLDDLDKDIAPILRQVDPHLEGIFDDLWKQRPKSTVRVHGDFNISNILFDDDLVPVAVLDWVETCWGFPGWDLISIFDENPSLRDSMLSTYQQITEHFIPDSEFAFSRGMRALFSTTIASRLKDEKHYQQSKAKLEALGYSL